MIGATYSVSHYETYNLQEDKSIFEDIIDSMVLDGVAGMNESFKSAISSLPLREKRMAILSLLDKDLNLFKRIKSLISDEKLTKVNHLKEVILMLREYVKVGEVEKKKFGEVMTDLNLVKHILSRIPEDDFKNPYKTFIDLANGTGVFPLVVIYRLMKGLEEWEPNEEKRYKHIVENQIYVSEIQPKNMFLYLCLIDPYDEYDLNIYCGSSLDDGFKKHMKEVWKKETFDYSIGNPPFNQMIDMKFVKLSYEITDAICIVHPSTWLLDEKGKQRAFTETKNLVGKHLESIELFNGNKIFNIALFVPCVITYIDKNKKSKGIHCVDKINDVQLIYDDIHQINKYSNKDIYLSLKDKIKNFKNENVWNKYKKDNKVKDYMISFTGIRGNVNLKTEESMVQKDFYTIVSTERKPQMSNEIVGDSFLKFYFENEFECNNFLNYLKTNFVRFMLSIYKNNQNLHRGELEIIPFLDFTQEWSDEKLYKEFNLTDAEIKFIEKHIPKYY